MIDLFLGYNPDGLKIQSIKDTIVEIEFQDGERHRKSLDMLPESWTELAQVAKKHKITQGEVVELMILILRNSASAAEVFDKKRVAKVAARQPKKELNSLLRGMTPEQLSAALAAAKKVQS